MSESRRIGIVLGHRIIVLLRLTARTVLTFVVSESYHCDKGTTNLSPIWRPLRAFGGGVWPATSSARTITTSSQRSPPATRTASPMIDRATLASLSITTSFQTIESLTAAPLTIDEFVPA